MSSVARHADAQGGSRVIAMAPGWATKVQRTWAEQPTAVRVRVLRAFRHAMSPKADAICEAIGAEYRTDADVRVSEILPLLAACEFLEKHTAKILARRSLGFWGRPLWLAGVRSEIERVPLGCVLVIGPSNYPLFLPGVQVLQALVAGNAVAWKPGRGGYRVARLFAAVMIEAGLPEELLRVTDDSVEAGRAALAAGADKVFFTGSGVTGRAVMRQLAETGTPNVMELSGCSSVIVLPGADLGRVTAAVVFGMRLNGSATCMAPRRLLVVGASTARRKALVQRVEKALESVGPVHLPESAASTLCDLIDESRKQGAIVRGEIAGRGDGQRPVLLEEVDASMRIAQADIFAPVLSVIDVADEAGALEAERECPMGLTTSIFGPEDDARRMARRIVVGTVVINDVIIPTADPRIPFGGRNASGFGVTRGAEGLLEMTALRTVMVRRGKSVREYEPTGEAHTKMFDGLILAGHAGTWRQRWRGLKQMIGAAKDIKPEKRERYDGE